MPNERSLEDLHALLEFASPRQSEMIRAVIDANGDREAAAQALGVSRTYMRDQIWRASRKRTTQDPEVHRPPFALPPGMVPRGVSQLVDGDGNVRLSWWKTERDKKTQRLQELREAWAEEVAAFQGLIPAAPPPEVRRLDHQCTIYPWGDPHLGLYGWGEETGGESWNLDKAERAHMVAQADLVERAPPTAEAILPNLGDYFHSDDSSNRTARSGNALDVDTRYARVIRVGLRLRVHAIKLALTKHQHVRSIELPGNHDDHSALWLSLALEAAFSDEPRVTIDTSPSAFRYVRFGRCLFGFVHGDQAKPLDLPGIMSVDRARDWGESEFRHFYTGHVHHDQRKELRGCTVESFRTLAGPDAYHGRAGYRSGRDMRAHVWDADLGRIGELIWTHRPEMKP